MPIVSLNRPREGFTLSISRRVGSFSRLVFENLHSCTRRNDFSTSSLLSLPQFFRSLYQNAEEHGPVWAVRDDDRITRVGLFIRKFRLDELPQILNVLRGEMS